VILNMGAADIGTGTKTVMAMIVAEELGVPLDRIRIEHADTGTTLYSAPSGGSKTVPSDSPAVRAAALDLKSKLLELAAEQLKTPVESLELRGGEISARGGSQKVAIGNLAALRQQQALVGVGKRAPNPTGKTARPFAAHFAEVEVNRYTGEIRVLRMVAAQDSGRVLNLLTYRNQVFGGLTMGIGFALTERRVMDQPTGKMANAHWHDDKIPTAMDVPAELTCVPVDMHDHEWNNTSTKGIGEPATIPAAAAIANAFYHATGVRARSAPMTPSAVIGLLSQGKVKG
jgi:xanthine dehydrogenase YagR molybdenum-binding subunit